MKEKGVLTRGVNLLLSQEQLQQFKHILLGKQAKLIEQTKEAQDLQQSETDAVGELSSYDNHPGDLATELYERGKDLALNQNKEQELEAINASLHAIEEGTYGICKTCSMDIPIERLVAMPTADTCIEHASSALDMDKRPVEEEVYHTHINPERHEEESGYDGEDAWQEVSRYGTSETPSDFFGDRDSYDEVYPNSNEDIGYVEDVERYPSTE